MSFAFSENVKPNWKKYDQDIETLVISEYDELRKPQIVQNCVVVPIIPDEPQDEADYKVKQNPTRDFLEKYLAKVEGCKYVLTFASGCAAINAILQTILCEGSQVIAMKTIYGGTATLLTNFEKFGIAVDFFEGFGNDAKKRIVELLKPNTKLIWLESPANPTLQLVDISEIVEIGKNQNPDVLVVVDNTFLTPVFQRPLDLGADIAVYSCSKYLGGFQDMFMGCVSVNSPDLFRKLRRTQETTGAIPSPVECSMMIRSLKTLPIRMKQHSESAVKIAKFLENHPKVEKVVHPGLSSHPQHSIALKQQFGHSGALGIYLKHAKLEESNKFLKNLKIFLRAPSLGAAFSIANLPSKRSHAEVPREILQRLGITDNFIRLSVGLENEESLMADLNQALSFV